MTEQVSGDRADSPEQPEHAPWLTPQYRDLVEEIRRMSRRKTATYSESMLETSAFNILWVLYDGPRTLRELTHDLELEQSTVNRQVNAAIKHGYVERYEVPGSLSKLLRPTASGFAALEHDGMLRVRRLERVFADLSPGTPESLLHELRAFNQAYERALAMEAADADVRSSEVAMQKRREG